jgi:hypothetical protein
MTYKSKTFVEHCNTNQDTIPLGTLIKMKLARIEREQL